MVYTILRVILFSYIYNINSIIVIFIANIA